MVLGPSAALALPDVVGAHPDALVLVVAHSSTPIRGGPTSSRKLDARRQATRSQVFQTSVQRQTSAGEGWHRSCRLSDCPPCVSSRDLGRPTRAALFAQCRSVP